MTCAKHGYTNNVICPACDLDTIEVLARPKIINDAERFAADCEGYGMPKHNPFEYLANTAEPEPMPKTETPLTDTAAHVHSDLVHAEFARRLERERGELIEALENCVKLFDRGDGKPGGRVVGTTPDLARALLAKIKNAT